MVKVDGRKERDNAFWGMYGPGFLYLKRHNVILVNNEAVDATQILNRGQSYRLPPGMPQQVNPHRFPMMPHEACRMVGEIQGHHPHWKDSLCLLGEFDCISSSVQITHRDLTMQTVIDRCAREWADILTQYHQLEPPPFIPLTPGNAMTNVKGSNHRTGLVHPINSTLEDWCQYTAHHFRLGGRSTPISIGMDTVSQVSYPHMWGYLLSLILGSVTKCNGV